MSDWVEVASKNRQAGRQTSSHKQLRQQQQKEKESQIGQKKKGKGKGKGKGQKLAMEDTRVGIILSNHLKAAIVDLQTSSRNMTMT